MDTVTKISMAAIFSSIALIGCSSYHVNRSSISVQECAQIYRPSQVALIAKDLSDINVCVRGFISENSGLVGIYDSVSDARNTPFERVVELVDDALPFDMSGQKTIRGRITIDDECWSSSSSVYGQVVICTPVARPVYISDVAVIESGGAVNLTRE